LRTFCTARLVSDASSSTMYCTLLPAISFGSSAIVFFSGIPSDAAGPVADSVTPIFTCADAVAAAHARPAASKASIHRFIFIFVVSKRCSKNPRAARATPGLKQVNNLTISHCGAYTRFPAKNRVHREPGNIARIGLKTTHDARYRARAQCRQDEAARNMGKGSVRMQRRTNCPEQENDGSRSCGTAPRESATRCRAGPREFGA